MAVAEGGLEPHVALVGTRTRIAVRAAAMVPLAVQLVVLLVRTYDRYDRYNLSIDFAVFHQAWHQIAHGDLSPQSTILGYPYWRAHFELVMWLLAPLHWIFRPGILLLWLQDAATVAAEGVALWWAADILERRRQEGVPDWAVAVLLATAGVLAAVNPWIYVASGQDLHLQAFAVLFAVLAARDLWSGRLRRGAVWIALTLTTGDVSGTYVAGIGLSVLLADRRRWRLGLCVLGAGVGWIALATGLHVNRASGVGTYTWLIGGSAPQGVVGGFAIVAGIVLHPSKALSVLADRWDVIVQQLVPAGTIGIVAPWVAGPIVLVLLENALNRNPFFIAPSYQNLPVYIFAITGTPVVVAALVRRAPARWRTAGTLLITAVLATGAAHLALTREEPLHYYRVDASTAEDLDRVAAGVPDDAEVIASFGISGRFAGRRHVYIHSEKDQVVPVRAGRVAFVFAPRAGNQPLPADDVVNVALRLRDELGARPLLEGPSVFAYLWTPPSGTDSVVLSAG